MYKLTGELLCFREKIEKIKQFAGDCRTPITNCHSRLEDVNENLAVKIMIAWLYLLQRVTIIQQRSAVVSS